MSFADDEPFDEEPTGSERSARRRSRPPRSGGGSGREGGSPFQQPGVRILIAVGILIILIVILVSTIRGCQRDRLESSYKSYFAAANQIAKESTDQGTQLQTLLRNKQFLKRQQITPQITELATQAQGLVDRAQDLNPPGDVDGAHRTLITALEYRALGLSQLPTAIDGAVTARDKKEGAATLAAPLQVLQASDVIYRTSYVAPSEEAIKADDIKDVQVARSDFFPGSTVEMITPAGAARVINQLQQSRPAQSGTNGGTHGLSIATVFAVNGSDRKQLIPGSTVALVGSADLKFEVAIENGGDFTETQVEVTFTYVRPDIPDPTVQKETIAQIEPGESNRQTLTFPLGTSPYFTDASTIKVQVAPVPEEQRTDNNSYEYSVEFNLQ